MAVRPLDTSSSEDVGSQAGYSGEFNGQTIIPANMVDRSRLRVDHRRHVFMSMPRK